MRFFTCHAKEARTSVLWATTWIGYFYVVTFISVPARSLRAHELPPFVDAQGGLLGGGNMPHNTGQRGGRQRFSAYIRRWRSRPSGVVAGRTLWARGRVDDLYATVLKHGQDAVAELRVRR